MAVENFELEPTKKNLLDNLLMDSIDRNESLWHFACICTEQKRKCSIGLDGMWGSGKTFFVKQAKMLIEAFNDLSSSLDADEKNKIKDLFKKYNTNPDRQIVKNPQVCVYYDAWENDNDIDPIISLIYQITLSTANDYPFPEKEDCISIIPRIFDFFTGRNLSTIMDSLSSLNCFSELKNQKKIHENINEYLKALLEEQGDRLIVFIDELDRCKPSYAVQLLERIKHYFGNDYITFVFSINSSELQHTIKRYYGEEFDAYRYLDRFFDYRIPLPEANYEKYYRLIGFKDSGEVFYEISKMVIKQYSFGLREIEKYNRIIKISSEKLLPKISFYSFSSNNGYAFGTVVIVPILLGLMIYDGTLFNDFISGNNPKPLLSLFTKEIAPSYQIFTQLLENNESYGFFNENENEKEIVDFSDKLTQMYNAIFSNNDKQAWEETRIGNCAFSSKTKTQLIMTISMLTSYANY